MGCFPQEYRPQKGICWGFLGRLQSKRSHFVEESPVSRLRPLRQNAVTG